MSDDFKRQIRDSFEQKETEELLALWQANNRAEWSALSFEVIAEILQDRLGEIPAQGEPCYELTKIEEKEPEVDLRDEDDPASPLYPFLCVENAPVLYRPKDVLRLERGLNCVAIAAAALSLIQWVVLFVGAIIHSHMELLPWLKMNGLSSLLGLGLVIVSAAITFVTLRALAVILKMLMQMEFRSRGIGARSGPIPS